MEPVKSPENQAKKSSKRINKQKEYQEPRFFAYYIKDQCWKQSPPMVGRDPDRWRMDAVGNPVLNALRGCQGPYCHEYDHIVPYSKGGKSVLENCQVLQTKVNRYKSNLVDVSFSDLKNSSAPIFYNEKEMDLLEKAVYGDVKKTKTWFGEGSE